VGAACQLGPHDDGGGLRATKTAAMSGKITTIRWPMSAATASFRT
jgi:hypothetical protein